MSWEPKAESLSFMLIKTGELFAYFIGTSLLERDGWADMHGLPGRDNRRHHYPNPKWEEKEKGREGKK